MKQILLVDDDADMLMLTGRWLEREGFLALPVHSGREALDALGVTGVDLIVLDYAMPEMDGPAVLEALRKNPALSAIPVLFRTGKEDADSAEIMEKLHPEGIVPKAEGKAALLEAVKRILSA